jgi:hypothetical protein
MKKMPDYCRYLVYDVEKQENVCTCRYWLWFHCNDDCVRMGDMKSETVEKLIAEADPKRVEHLKKILVGMKNKLHESSENEKEKLREAIERVEYDILRYKHKVPWLPKYRNGVEEKNL